MSDITSKAKSVNGIVVIVGAIVTLIGLIIMWCQNHNVDTGPLPLTPTKTHIIGVLIAFLLNVIMYFFGCMHFAIPSFSIFTVCGPFLAFWFRHHNWNAPAKTPHWLFFFGAIIAFVGYFLTCAAILPFTEKIIPSSARLGRPQFVVALIVMILTLIGGIWIFVDYGAVSSAYLGPMFWGVYFFLADIWHLDFLMDSYVLPIGAYLWATFNPISLTGLHTAPLVITYVGLCIGLAWVLLTLLFTSLREGNFAGLRGATIAPAAKGAVAA